MTYMADVQEIKQFLTELLEIIVDNTMPSQEFAQGSNLRTEW